MSKLLRVPVERLREGGVVLEASVARYVTRVHRLTVGDRFVAFDPAAGTEAEVRITAVGPKSAQGEILEVRPAGQTGDLPVTLLQAIGKGDRFERALRDATALGVRRIVGVLTERVVSRPKHAEARRARWETLAIQAARQSGRGDLPELDGPCSLQDAVALAPRGLRFFLDPTAQAHLGGALSPWDGVSLLAVFIGPEGGLSAPEMSALSAAGFTGARFGPFVLRTETAATAVLGAVRGRVDVARG